jgi:valyl-tRNA synthetase
MRFSAERVEASRNFANKIWNAARFTLMNLTDETDFTSLDTSALRPEDKWVLSLYNKVVKETRENLDKFEIGIAVGGIYDFLWDILCDWYIELIKPRLFAKEGESNKAAQQTLNYVLSGTLKLLHPFMPFITEEIWQALPHVGDSIMVSDYPAYDEALNFPADEKYMSGVIEAIKAVRNRRAEMNVPPSRKAHIFIKTPDRSSFEGSEIFFEKLASAAGVSYLEGEEPENAVSIVSGESVLYLPVNEMVDTEAERARLTKELENAEKMIASANAKLNNADFVSRAPEKVVNIEKDKLEKFTSLKVSILAELERLG